MIFKNHKYLFYLIFLFLPLNLGKHFIFKWSYISGILSDYFVPTIYIQDILIFLLLLWWVFSLTKKDFIDLLSRKTTVFSTAFLFSIFLSVVGSHSVFPSLYAYTHLFLYSGLFLYTLANFQREDWQVILKLVAIDVIFLGILGIFQWLTQGSVFDSYLFFGEQPYNFSTYGIVRDNFLGFTRVPAYGLFRHPNIFGGYLAVVLLWVLPEIEEIRKSRLFRLSFVLGVVALFFTLSYISWGVFLLGIIFRKVDMKVALLITGFIAVASLLLPLIHSTNASIYRRADLLSEGGRLIKGYSLFGVGLNNSVLFAPEAGFLQPIHNVIVLIWSESGLFAVTFFIILIVSALRKSSRDSIIFISLLQIILLSGLDHYFYTIHQTQLLFWILLGIVFSPSTLALANTTNKTI